jgi:S1-C subfamily serine protease
MKEHSWMKIIGVCFTVSLVVGMIGGALTNEYFIGYIFSNFFKDKTEENAPIVKKVIEERTFVEETLIKDAFDKAVPSLVSVLSYDKGIGTGFFVSTDGVVATCKSVADKSATPKVKANDGIIYNTKVIYKDKNFDFAFLKVEETDQTPYFKASDFSENPLTISQKILTIGLDSEFNQHVKSGIVSYIGNVEVIDEYDELDFEINDNLNCGLVVNLGGEALGMAVKSNSATYVLPISYINRQFQEVFLQ